MKTNEMPIEQRYGYHIISTDEDKKKFAPKLATDEVLREYDEWIEPSFKDGRFYEFETYRRKIDVGEGYKLVGLDELIKEGDEWSEDGIEWIKTYYGVGESVLSYHGSNYVTIHHIRRKKSSTQPASKTFYMVHVDGMRQPLFKHESVDLATEEAKRLALQESKSATVLECKEVIRVNYVPPTTPTTEVTKL